MQTVNILLKNEKYLGQIVYNRRSYKLQMPPISNLPSTRLFANCSVGVKRQPSYRS